MRKFAVVVLAVAILTMPFAVAPVMARGPVQAAEVGHNPNLTGIPGAPFAQLEAGENTKMWVNGLGFVSVDVPVTTGGGRMNNAIIADIGVLMTMLSDPPGVPNEWIFLSGETNGPKWNNPGDDPDAGAHGIMYWFAEFAFGPGYGAYLVQHHPDGVFIMQHDWGK